jgi:cation diffusion facilitator CzcD-associated flavoprotein CzcO
VVPDSDLFRTLRDGSASVVTDTIETFTPAGIRLTSGRELEADIIISATGLKLKLFGGIDLSVDGAAVTPSETMTYKGLMVSGIPNFVFTVGYTNASWTLKADLTCAYVCRLLNHMQKHGYTQCVPRLNDATVKEVPWLDFSSGYVQRASNVLPKQGDKVPWRVHQNYALDLVALKLGSVEDGVMEFK